MRRLLLVMAIAFVAAVAAAWLADHPGQAVIEWEGWRLETSAVVLVAILLVAALVLLVLFRIVVWLFRDTPLAPERRRERRQRKGMEAVNQTLVALAAGHVREAGRRAEEAVKFLGATPLTLMLRAEAASLRGDDMRAHEALTALAEREDAGVMGYRGLAARALKRNDMAELRAALAAAENRDPECNWVRSLRLLLLVREGQWAEARRVLRDLRRGRMATEIAFERQEAALAQAEAVEADLSGNGNEALDLAREALKLDPKLTPAAVLAARLAQGAGRSGLRDGILKDAFAARPHPDIIQAALAGFENETPGVRHRRVVEVTQGAPDHPESLLARGETALAAEYWAEARRDLEAAGKAGSARAFELLAQLEEAQSGDRDAAAGWRARAQSVADDPHWVCESCGAGRRHWAPRCTSCDAVGSFDWRPAGGISPTALRPQEFSLLA